MSLSATLTTIISATATMASTTVTEAPSSTTTEAAPSCTTAVPGPNGHVPYDACNSYYNFDPAFAPALAVSIIFAVLSGLHITEAIIFRKASPISLKPPNPLSHPY